MDTLLAELISVLKSEYDIYKEILSISREKTDTIVQGKTAQLESLLKTEQSLVTQAIRTGTMREQLIDKLAAYLQLPAEKLTLSDVLKHVREDVYENLADYQQSMKLVISELKNTNELNAKLINSSLEYIKFSINVLAGAGAGNSYTNSGKVNETKRQNLFDIKL